MKFFILLLIGMKKVFHKITAFVLAFVVLFSTISFTINMHYCGDILVDTAIFHKAKGCGMEMEAFIPTSKPVIQKTPCCKDQHILVKGQDELQTSLDKTTINHQEYVAIAMIYSYLNLFESLPKEPLSFKEYSPPDVIPDIQVLHQVFII